MVSLGVLYANGQGVAQDFAKAQSFNGNTQYYDTSQGCPVGTYQWVDSWGNQICRQF